MPQKAKKVSSVLGPHTKTLTGGAMKYKRDDNLDGNLAPASNDVFVFSPSHFFGNDHQGSTHMKV